MLQANTGRYSSLEAGSDGRLHLAYYDYDYARRDLRYAVRSASGQWSFETVDTQGDVGWSASLELDSGGIPHIAYAEYWPNFKLKYAVRRGPNDWVIETVDSEPGRGFYAYLALDSAGNPHIAYTGNKEWDLRHAWKHPQLGWQFETIESAGDVGFYCAIVLDSADRCRISYYDRTNGRLKFAWQQPGGGWSIDVVDSSPEAGLDTSLVLDDQEHPHIAYWDKGIDGVKYARHDGSQWHVETVETGDFCGTEPSIRWAQAPRMSYAGTVGVRYAEKVAGHWRYYQLDRSGSKCSDTSLALEGAGHPRVTYLNLADGALYYVEGVDSQLPGAPTPQPVSTIAAARSKPDGTWVSLGGQVVSASGNVSGCYIEDPDRVAGICLVAPEYATMPVEGQQLQVVGVIETRAGPERLIRVTDWTATGVPGVPGPLGLTLKGLETLVPTYPLTTLGLLVRVAGRVVTTGAGYVVLDDGSAAPGEEGLRVRVGEGWSGPGVGQFAAVTGVISIETIGGNPTAVLLPRRSGDIQVIPD